VVLAITEFEPEKLSTIMKEIEEKQMKTYETEIGVSGVGVLNNLHHHHELQESIKKIYLTSSLGTLSHALSSSPSHQPLHLGDHQPQTNGAGPSSSSAAAAAAAAGGGGPSHLKIFWSFA
jgi:hypothetical protein